VCVWCDEGEISESVSVWRLNEVERVKVDLDCLSVGMKSVAWRRLIEEGLEHY
jgi:hypothetical protein